ncbi:MAG: HXXEE domain-containing protein [Methanomicrobiales archaeon]|jgi:hypothetical protein|nr:HXXEE domain-containing protein [Methanomicrobiales archaeon]
MTSETRDNSDRIARIFTNLNTAWQVVGSVAAPILFTLLFILYMTDTSLIMYQWLMWLHLPVIMIHEFEEYIFPGGFKTFINKKTILANKECREDSILNEPYIFLVNPLLIWPWAILGAVFYTIPWIGFGLIIFQFVINNLQHTITFQLVSKGYNPGLGTTVFLLIPYCTVVTWYVLTHPILTTTDWVLSLLLCGVIFLTLLSITHMRMKHAATG